MELIADAEARNRAREVERHRCIVQRIEKLLAEHGEPIFAGAPNVAADSWIRTPPLLESCIR